MSREEEIAKIDAELEKLGVDTDEDVEEEDVDTSDDAEDDDGEEEVVVNGAVVATEDKPEEVKEEPKPEIKLEINTDLPAATLGYKLREEARKREALEQQLAELKKAPRIAKEEDLGGYLEGEIGTTKQEIAELRAWKEEQQAEKLQNEQREGAFRELRGYEVEAEQAFPDFGPAANYAKSMIAASIKLLEPNISPEDLAERTVYKYAEHAALALNSKKHPGQAIYEMAHQWGYKKAEDRPQITEVLKQDNKPSIAKIGENKKKSAGMAGGGNGKAFVNMDAVSSMTNAERMKLTESDWARLEAEG